MNQQEKKNQTKNKETERAEVHEVHQGPQRVFFQGRDN